MAFRLTEADRTTLGDAGVLAELQTLAAREGGYVEVWQEPSGTWALADLDPAATLRGTAEQLIAEYEALVGGGGGGG